MVIGTFIRSVFIEVLSSSPQRKHIRSLDSSPSADNATRSPCASLCPTSHSSTFLHILHSPFPSNNPMLFSHSTIPGFSKQFPTYLNYSSYSKSYSCFQAGFLLDSNQPNRLDFLELVIDHFSAQACLSSMYTYCYFLVCEYDTSQHSAAESRFVLPGKKLSGPPGKGRLPKSLYRGFAKALSGLPVSRNLSGLLSISFTPPHRFPNSSPY